MKKHIEEGAPTKISTTRMNANYHGYYTRSLGGFSVIDLCRFSSSLHQQHEISYRVSFAPGGQHRDGHLTKSRRDRAGAVNDAGYRAQGLVQYKGKMIRMRTETNFVSSSRQCVHGFIVERFRGALRSRAKQSRIEAKQFPPQA